MILSVLLMDGKVKVAAPLENILEATSRFTLAKARAKVNATMKGQEERGNGKCKGKMQGSRDKVQGARGKGLGERQKGKDENGKSKRTKGNGQRANSKGDGKDFCWI